jgi:hypothetical protein
MRKEWKTLRLEEVCKEITDGSHFSPTTTDTGYPYVTVRDIENDQIDFANCKFISAADYNQLLRNGCSGISEVPVRISRLKHEISARITPRQGKGQVSNLCLQYVSRNGALRYTPINIDDSRDLNLLHREVREKAGPKRAGPAKVTRFSNLEGHS